MKQQYEKISLDKLKQGPIRHASFDVDRKDRIANIKNRLSEVDDKSMEEWEDGFRRDMNPDKEIALFDVIADIFSQFTQDQGFSQKVKKNIYYALVLMTLTDRENIEKNVDCTGFSMDSLYQLVT